MKSITLAIVFFATSMFYSCNSDKQSDMKLREGHGSGGGDGAAPPDQDAAATESEAMSKFESPQQASANLTSQSGQDPVVVKGEVSKKKIIKDGNMSVQTEDIAASKKTLDDLVKSLNGYYEREDLQNNDQRTTYDLKIRVPSANFEKLISGIENGKDEITGKSIQARDVTEEYVDIETRLASKRNYLKRYLELLSKANTVKDILAIEENIRVLQEEIESQEGRLKLLNDQIGFSTLEVNLFRVKEFVYKPQPKDNFSERIKKSLSGGWTAVTEVVLAMVSLWPFLLIGGGVLYLVRRSRKNHRKD